MRKTISSLLTIALLIALVVTVFAPCTVITASAASQTVTFRIPDVRIYRYTDGAYMPAETYTFNLEPGVIDPAIDVPQNGIPVLPGPAVTYKNSYGITLSSFSADKKSALITSIQSKITGGSIDDITNLLNTVEAGTPSNLPRKWSSNSSANTLINSYIKAIDSSAQATTFTSPANTITSIGSNKPYLAGRNDIVVSAAFDQPGIYKYRLTQVTGTQPGETYDTQAYNVYVYYGYNTATATTPTVISTFCYPESDNYTLGNASGKKTAIFTNRYSDSHLKIEKEVAGNAGSATQEFQFYVAVRAGTSGVPVGTSIPVTVKKNGVVVQDFTSITISADNASENVGFKLKDGDVLDIQGLPIGAKYIVSESSQIYDDGYVATVECVSGDATLNNNFYYPGRMIGNVAANNELLYTNTKEEVVTGLFDDYTPYIAMMLCAMTLSAIYFISKRKIKNRI